MTQKFGIVLSKSEILFVQIGQSLYLPWTYMQKDFHHNENNDENFDYYDDDDDDDDDDEN